MFAESNDIEGNNRLQHERKLWNYLGDRGILFGGVISVHCLKIASADEKQSDTSFQVSFATTRGVWKTRYSGSDFILRLGEPTQAGARAPLDASFFMFSKMVY